MASWKPTDEESNFLISPIYEDISRQLEHLQEETGCPDSYLCSMLEAISDRWGGQA